MFMRKFSARFFHVGRAVFSVDKSALATLRKKTGYTFSNCRNALEKSGGDLTKVRPDEIDSNENFSNAFILG